MNEIGDIQAGDPYVVSFDDTRALNRALVGGKGANLAQLVNAGLPVPAGFCVTTAVYEVLIDTSSIKEAIHELSFLDPANSEQIADAGADLRARIREQQVPKDVRDTIKTSLDIEGSDPEQAYAIRSSATAEDLPEASFAGQQETYLNFHGADEIIDRVRDCMASLFTDRAIAYRAKNNISHEKVALAVVIQEMVIPDVSGILFTADPQTGNRHVASIEAGYGLGEALVSGDATADTIRVDTRTNELLDYDVSDQQVAVRPRPEGGTETVELDSGDGTSRVLSEDQTRALVEIGMKIESLFESPQDIEWCLNNGELSIVQARPITSLFPLPSPLPTDDRLHVYYSVGHGQAFGEAMPPLVQDIWKSFTNVLFGLDPNSHWVVEAGGRTYIDMTSLLQVNTFQPIVVEWISATSEPARDGLDDLLSRRSEEFGNRRIILNTLTKLPALGSAVWTGVKIGLPTIANWIQGFPGAFFGEPTPEQEEELWNKWGQHIAAQVRASNSPTQRVTDVFNPTYAGFTDFPRGGPLLAAIAAGGVLRRLFPDANDEVNAIGKGLPDELVTRINLDMSDIADVARDHPAVVDAIREGKSLEEIGIVEGGDAFLAAFDEFLDEFGHRATGELDISRHRWREDSSGLLATIRANLEHDENGEQRERIHLLEHEAKEAAARLERRASRGVAGPIRKRLVRQLIQTHRGYIQTREVPKHGVAYLFSAWHDVLLDAGETLVTEGVLNSSEDVWFLRKDELFAALDGDSIDVDLTARREEFESDKTMDAPPLLTSEGEAPIGQINRKDISDDTLVGTGVSSGVVEGTARVIHDPSEETIEKGEILIAPSSDPGWTPLFLNAAGMVVEVGGRMSHGALVAREYGLPAVVSIPEATRRIETGQRVRIDGTQGTVEIIEDD